MNHELFALIDCNNFFVACEQLFRPDLINKPVVVLSSNDGCVVSRSNEAKALGIPMAAPAFKYKAIFRQHGVTSFSANFELYGDISQRLTRLLTSVSPRTEVYSVDESFIEISSLDIADYTTWGEALRARVLREVGIAVSIGLSRSKTLSKLACERAKHDPKLNGVLDLINVSQDGLQSYLGATPIKDVWGVGWRLAPKLQAEGVFNALDLQRLRPQLAESIMGVHGRRLVAELAGVSCLPLELSTKASRSIMHGRVFGNDSGQFEVVEAAIASLMAGAASRLRKQQLLAKKAMVTASTNRHKPEFHSLSRFLNFETPTADSGQLIAAAVQAIGSSFKAGQPYHRVNVLLYDLVSDTNLQTDLFGEVKLAQHSLAKHRSAAIDGLNSRYGKGTVRYAAEDLAVSWQPHKDKRSPRYTTNWQELPVILAN